MPLEMDMQNLIGIGDHSAKFQCAKGFALSPVAKMAKENRPLRSELYSYANDYERRRQHEKENRADKNIQRTLDYSGNNKGKPLGNFQAYVGSDFAWS